jgi:hypothetical protein
MVCGRDRLGSFGQETPVRNCVSLFDHDPLPGRSRRTDRDLAARPSQGITEIWAAVENVADPNRDKCPSSQDKTAIQASRPKLLGELREFARQRAAEALQTIVGIMRSAVPQRFACCSPHQF